MTFGGDITYLGCFSSKISDKWCAFVNILRTKGNFAMFFFFLNVSIDFCV